MSENDEKVAEATETVDVGGETPKTAEEEVKEAFAKAGVEDEPGKSAEADVDITTARAGSPMEETDPAAKVLKEAAEGRNAQTIGERRVRVNFNVAQGAEATAIDEIKAITALLIDKVNALPNNGPESGRLKSLAMTKYEEAGMWAVKTATS